MLGILLIISVFHSGKSESLYETILTLQEENNIPINIGVRELMDLLQTLIQRKDVRKKLNFLQLNVPFRFFVHG